MKAYPIELKSPPGEGNPQVKQQKAYRLDPPLKDYDGTPHEHVIVSAASVMFSGPETYIFPANAQAEIVSWGELPGSQRGTLDCEGVIEELGYSIEPS